MMEHTSPLTKAKLVIYSISCDTLTHIKVYLIDVYTSLTPPQAVVHKLFHLVTQFNLLH